MVPLQILSDFWGGDDLPNVEGHFEQISGILPVEVGVEIVLIVGLLPRTTPSALEWRCLSVGVNAQSYHASSIKP